jgi:hypothetical protein
MELSAKTLEYTDDALICTSIPARGASDILPRDERNHGSAECLLTGAAKRVIYNAPGFPKDITCLRSSQKHYFIKSTTTMGLGMFAGKNLNAGDLILAERPLMVVPMILPMPVNFPPELNAEQKVQAYLHEAGKTLKRVFDRMTPSDQKSFLALSNAHTAGGNNEMFGIVRTNGLGISELAREETTDVFADMYSGICDNLSRVNHR